MSYFCVDQEDIELDSRITVELQDVGDQDKISLSIQKDPFNRYLPVREITYKLNIDEAKQMIETLQSFVNESKKTRE